MWVSFLVKTKAEHVFLLPEIDKMMYTIIECLSVCDWEKEHTDVTRQGECLLFPVPGNLEHVKKHKRGIRYEGFI